MPNKVFLGENDIIFNLYEGDQAQESIQNMVNENNRIITKLRRQNKPVLVLADLTKLGQSSIGSRQASADALKNKDYDKVALFAKLKRIFAKTIAGDFTQKVDFSDVSDKFFETFVGVQIVLDTIREIQKKNQELEEKLKEAERLKPPR